MRYGEKYKCLNTAYESIIYQIIFLSFLMSEKQKIKNQQHILTKSYTSHNYLQFIMSRNQFFIYTDCVATLQGQAGQRYSCRWSNIHGAGGMSAMPLFIGGRPTHAASCVFPCMLHVVALAPQRGTHRGTCPLAGVSHHHPQQGSPYLFK